MAARIRLLAAFGALVSAVIVVVQAGRRGARADRCSCARRPTDCRWPTTTIKWPVIDLTDPDPFDPCRDIPFDVIQRIGLAFTPPEPEDSLRCHYDAGNYQMAVEAFVWRTYEQACRPMPSRLDIDGHRAAQFWVMKPTDWNNRWWITCMIAFKTRLRRDPAVAVLLAGPLAPTTSTVCRPTCSGPTNWRRTTSTEAASWARRVLDRRVLKRSIVVTAEPWTLRRPRRRTAAGPAAAHHRLLRPHVACRYRCATASSWSPTTTRPLTGDPAGHFWSADPYGRGFRCRFCSAACTPRAAITWSCRAFAARSVPAARSTRWSTKSPTAPTPWPGYATSLGSPARSPRWGVVPGLHPVGAADRPAAGNGGRRHHRSGRTTSAGLLGHRVFRAQRLPRVEREVARQEETGAHPGPVTSGAGQTADRARDRAACRWARPPADARRRRAVVRVLGGAPRTRRPVLGFASTASALERAEIPVLLLTGWQDLFIEQTLDQYAQLRRRDVEVALTIGGWKHPQMLTTGAPTVLRESLAWFDAHVARGRRANRSPVRIHVNHHGWLDLAHWPPPMPEQVRYLQPGGRLGNAVPPDTAPASSFTYDPADPTPSIGGRLLSAEGGYRNDATLAERARRARPSPATRCRPTCMSSEPGPGTGARLPTTRMTTCSSGSARWTPRALPQRQRRIPA